MDKPQFTIEVEPRDGIYDLTLWREEHNDTRQVFENVPHLDETQARSLLGMFTELATYSDAEIRFEGEVVSQSASSSQGATA